MPEEIPPGVNANAWMAWRHRVYALQQRLYRHAMEAQEIAMEMADLGAEMLLVEADTDLGTFKKADGRLNDAGVAAINAAFQNGESLADIARRFEISPSAVSTRHQIWLANRRAPEVKPKPTPESAPEVSPESTMKDAPAAKPRRHRKPKGGR